MMKHNRSVAFVEMIEREIRKEHTFIAIEIVKH